MNKRRRWLSIVLVGVVGLMAGCSSKPSESASIYPEKAVNLVVPFVAGDTTDLISRAYADYAKTALKQPVVVVNKDGAGGSTGIGGVGKEKPDGYTILAATSGAMTIKPYLAKVSYTYEDFKPIGQMAELPFAIAVNKNSPFNNLKEFVDYAKENPGKLKYGSPGTGVSQHIGMETMAEKYGIKVVHIPHKGGNDAISAVLGNHVDLAIVSTTQVAAQLKAGELKVLGVSSEEKYPFMPEVPTFKEQGFDIVGSVWYGLFVPKDTPDSIVSTLVDTLKKASEDPNVLESWKKLAVNPSYLAPADFAKQIEQQVKENQDVIKAIGLEKK
jgi:tripartite-type tricarboxylate transporter receptor subunit TctC